MLPSELGYEDWYTMGTHDVSLITNIMTLRESVQPMIFSLDACQFRLGE